MPLATLGRYLALPLSLAPLLLIVIFSLLFVLATKAMLFGIPLLLILTSWFFKYSFAFLDGIVAGKQEPPVMSAEMINPVEQRPLGLFLVMIGFYGMTLGLRSYIGEGAAYALQLSALSIVPAMIAAMSVTGRFVQAFNPKLVFGLVARIPAAYATLLIVIAALWYLPAFLLAAVGLSGAMSGALGLAVSMYLWLAMIACIGGIVYEHRDELGYEPVESPERTEQKTYAETERDRDRAMDTIFAELRGGAYNNACKSAAAIVECSPTPVDEFRWLYARASKWPDQRLAAYLVRLCLPRMLEARASGEALDRVRERLRVDANFRPESSAQLLRLAALARDAGDRPTARILLNDFDRHFPNDNAALMAAKLAAEVAR